MYQGEIVEGPLKHEYQWQNTEVLFKRGLDSLRGRDIVSVMGYFSSNGMKISKYVPPVAPKQERRGFNMETFLRLDAWDVEEGSSFDRSPEPVVEEPNPEENTRVVEGIIPGTRIPVKFFLEHHEVKGDVAYGGSPRAYGRNGEVLNVPYVSLYGDIRGVPYLDSWPVEEKTKQLSEAEREVEATLEEAVCSSFI